MLTPAELDRLHAEPPAWRGHLATILFSAKESFYKAQYRLSRRLLDFRDVTLTLDLRAQRFTVHLVAPLALAFPVSSWVGRYCVDSGVVVTATSAAVTGCG